MPTCIAIRSLSDMSFDNVNTKSITDIGYFFTMNYYKACYT